MMESGEVDSYYKSARTHDRFVFCCVFCRKKYEAPVGRLKDYNNPASANEKGMPSPMMK